MPGGLCAEGSRAAEPRGLCISLHTLEGFPAGPAPGEGISSENLQGYELSTREKDSMRSQPVVSSLWFQIAVLTFGLGFTVLISLAYLLHSEQPPIPRKTVAGGQVLFTGDDVVKGQNVFQKYGLMEYGSIFGHGAYLGPDFTAQYLHAAALADRDFYARRKFPGLPAAVPPAEEEFKKNRYNPSTGALEFTGGQQYAFEKLTQFYRSFFADPSRQSMLKRPAILDPQEIHALVSYFAWSAWVAAANRPGLDYSYTNNWPPEPLVGNYPTAESVLWSTVSLVALLGGIGLILFAFGRFNLLGWHRLDEEGGETELSMRPPELVKLTPAQRATAWYFVIVAGLFLAQGLLGGMNAHYHVEPQGFYGLDLGRMIPYNLSRTWHVQLALFFVTASYLAMGIFIAPMIAGTEPRGQDKLALGLFCALVIVVIGSMAGEAANIFGWNRLDGPWFWLGGEGWEYLDLGRLWQILLVIGLFLWFAIIYRGLRPALAKEHPANLPFLFLYSALSIPLFYAAGLLIHRHSTYAMADFWRFWVVHLWVEDFLELFTTIMVAYIFVLLKAVKQETATRVVYLDIILYSVGGVIGTMHHLYFSGAPAVHMAFGAFFSAMEVVPLVLLTYEAWRFMRLGADEKHKSMFGAQSQLFPHKWAVLFLIAVGFWNFLGAGVFGFLINLPVVSYYEIGTQFTANHAHGAMMGVYGMLAIGFFMFVARYFVPADKGSERAMRLSFWCLNLGLAMMLFVNLAPIGMLQLYDSVRYGYWHARSMAFFQMPAVRMIEWLRLPGDVIFIAGGIFPVVYLAVRIVLNRHRCGRLEEGGSAEKLIR